MSGSYTYSPFNPPLRGGAPLNFVGPGGVMYAAPGGMGAPSAYPMHGSPIVYGQPSGMGQTAYATPYGYAPSGSGVLPRLPSPTPIASAPVGWANCRSAQRGEFSPAAGITSTSSGGSGSGSGSVSGGSGSSGSASSASDSATVDLPGNATLSFQSSEEGQLPPSGNAEPTSPTSPGISSQPPKSASPHSALKGGGSGAKEGSPATKGVTIASTPPKSVTVAATPHAHNRKCGLDDFVLLCKVGEGIAGKVWKVRRKDNNKLYAMKVMPKAAMEKGDVLEMLKAERSVMAVLKHSFIVTLRWAFQTKERAYLVMDWLGGGELGKHLEKCPNKRFDENRGRFYAAQLISSFEYLHSKNVIYRDLKMDNVLLDDDGNACLVDFGLWERPFLPGQSFFGAPNSYLTPEMLRGDAYGCENDWWQFGVLLYEMLIGRLPWICHTWTQLHTEILSPNPIGVPPGVVSAEAADFLLRILWKDKNTRLKSAKDIKAHPWFKSIDWEALCQRKIKPPFVPDVSHSTSMYFQTENRQALSFCIAPQKSILLRGFTFAKGDPSAPGGGGVAIPGIPFVAE